jgi:glucosamine-6-phosphate deaminase
VEVIVLPSPTEVGRLAARKVGQLIRGMPTAVIGFATGSSPLAIYAELGRLVRDGSLDASRVSGFALDEYVGIAEQHPQSERRGRRARCAIRVSWGSLVLV